MKLLREYLLLRGLRRARVRRANEARRSYAVTVPAPLASRESDRPPGGRVEAPVRVSRAPA